MNGPLIVTIWTGLAFATAGLAVGLWQVLSSPDQPNYPTSGAFKRLVMFWFMASILYRSGEIFVGAFAAEPRHMIASQAVSATLLAALMVTFLVDHVRHWLPARTHQRIRQLLSIARCRPSPALIAARSSAMKASTGEGCLSADVVTPALVELHMQGFQVAGPNEGPDAFNGRVK